MYIIVNRDPMGNLLMDDNLTANTSLYLPYRMEIYTVFSLATWLKFVKFMELNISKLWFFNFDYKATVSLGDS